MFQKLYRQLEEINTNTQASARTLHHSEESARKMSEQLAAIDGSIRAHKPFRLPPVLILTLIVTTCLGASLLIVVIGQTFSLSQTMTVALGQSAENARLSSVALARYQALEHKVIDLRENAGRLDSLVIEQARTIQELERLNKTNTQAYFRIKADLDQRETARRAAMREQ